MPQPHCHQQYVWALGGGISLFATDTALTVERQQHQHQGATVVYGHPQVTGFVFSSETCEWSGGLDLPTLLRHLSQNPAACAITLAEFFQHPGGCIYIIDVFEDLSPDEIFLKLYIANLAPTIPHANVNLRLTRESYAAAVATGF